MIIRIQNRRGTSSEWETSNPVLLSGEFGYETDTDKFKIGNGTDAWNDREYANVDIVYFSATDFEGAGTIADPIRIKL